ncbi:GNAT family N-acetyltransferase [Flavobacterium microcysteis]
MTFFTIETERLFLRKIVPETYHYVFEHFSEKELQEFLGISSPEKLQVEKEKFKNGITTHNKSMVLFQLLDKKSNKVIGGCGYHTWYLDHDRAEIGYALTDDNFKGMGLMSEALQHVLAYGFDAMQLHRVEAFISPNNKASIQLVNKFGFIKEGHLRQHYQKDGQFEDSVVYSLLKEEHLKR